MKLEDNHNHKIGLFGASGQIGYYLLHTLKNKKHQITAFSRYENDKGWIKLDLNSNNSFPDVDTLISTGPLDIFIASLSRCGIPAKTSRIIVVSSTSAIVKAKSSNQEEKEIADKLIRSEEKLKKLCVKNNVEWVIFRPTLVYGGPKNKNIDRIADWLERWTYFPVIYPARGLREPIHAEDFAQYIYLSIFNQKISNMTFSVTGGESLEYQDMVNRIITEIGRGKLLLIPKWIVYPFVKLLEVMGARSINSQMFIRQNVDLTFDSNQAESMFNFKPRPFTLKNGLRVKAK